MKVELDLSNYATNTDLKNAAGVDTLSFAIKFDLGNFKSNVNKLDIDKLQNLLTNLSTWKGEVDKLDMDKLVPAPVDVSKLRDALNNDVVKKIYILLR